MSVDAVLPPLTRQRRYSDAEVEAGVNAVLANKGYVKPIAEVMGIPRRTLADWWKQYREAARTGTTRQNTHPELAERFYALAYAAQDRAMEAVGSATAYQATLMAAISTDKGQVLTGGVTSRTETVKARYVEGDSLRSIASRVVDVPALSPGSIRSDRTPKVAGGQGRGSYLTQSAESKGKISARKKRSPSKRTRVLSEDIPAGNLISNPTESPIQGRITQNVPDSSG